MSKEQYMNPEFVADQFLMEWEKSGKGRIGAIAVCESAQGLYHLHMACYGNTTTLKKVSDVLFQRFLMEKAYQEECGIKSNAVVDGFRDFIFVNRFGNV